MSNSDNVRYIKSRENVKPVWKRIIVESNLPESLSPLRELSKNLWWVWNSEARKVFKYIDSEIWEECEHNPLFLLDEVNYKRFKELEKDAYFVSLMNAAYAEFQQYMNQRTTLEGPQIAYFSMEFGLHDSLKIFSGGLGILAGDYLKEASDMKTNLVAVGLLYRYGYFKQTLSLHGEQMANYEFQEFSKVPVQPALDKNGEWVRIQVDYPDRKLTARVWQVNIGSIKLFLLDADIPDNQEQDRYVTHHLYGGDNENRLKQEILLGIGGIRALNKLGYNSADVYHCNEGHAAFIGLERLANTIEQYKLTYAEAAEYIRSSTLFTTHTPVPAGHDSFHVDLLKSYMGQFPKLLGLEWSEFEMLGKANSQESHFNMSYLASHLSQGINGVSKLHGDVSKNVLKSLYEGYLEEELEIGYVTNGVHYPSWVAPEWRQLHREYFGNEFPENQLDFDVWKKIHEVPDEKIWEIRKDLRKKLIKYIKFRFYDNWQKRNENPKLISEVMGKLNPDALTIGFARRFATYKRGYLLFRDIDRLASILNNPERPVQFIFAGKAHPADKAGQDLIKRIVEISKLPEFRGKILFLQNYDINLAKKMLQGVDVWLNTPTRPLEASGTSGQKGVMNGTIHFSVLDGWWVEGYKENAGWALPAEREYDVQDFQDELDAETIYSILEDEIVDAFYDRNKDGLPKQWIDYIKNTISEVAPHFTTGRMMRDYLDRYYIPQSERARNISKDNFKWAKELAAWKYKVNSLWDKIEVKNIEFADGITNVMKVGNDYPLSVTLDLKGLNCEEIGLELIITKKEESGDVLNIIFREDFELNNCGNNECCYKLNFHPVHPGPFNYGLRMYPKNDGLPHRQDFKNVRWI